MKKTIIFIIIIFNFLYPTTDNIIFNNNSNKTILEDNKGIIEIKKINLKTQFIDNNKLNKNVIVINPSIYPNKDNSILILAGHSGYGKIAFFKNLYKLKINDEIVITYLNKEYTYIIKDIYYQKKTGTIKTYKIKNKKTLVLITCTKNNKESQTVYVSELRSDG